MSPATTEIAESVKTDAYYCEMPTDPCAVVMFGASGLFFLPYIAPALSSAPIVHALTHGLPSWDLSLLGVAAHGNALFFSALVPLVLLAVGVAAHLAFFAVVPMTTLHYVPHAFGLGGIWLAANALACLALARIALRR